MQSTERYEQSPTESPTSSPSAPHSDLPRLTEARPIIGRLGMVEHMSRVVVSTHSPKPSEPLSRTNFAIKPACGAATGARCAGVYAQQRREKERRSLCKR